MQENANNVLINIVPMYDSSMAQFGRQFQVNMDIDPPINQGVTHIFNQVCARAVSSVVEGQTGVVEGRLYRENTRLQNKYVSPGKNNARTFATASGGSRAYGMRINGKANGSRYRVTGSWVTSIFDQSPNGRRCAVDVNGN